MPRTRAPENLRQLLVFSMDAQKYALHLSSVVKVLRMVEITPLPKAPDIVAGVINVHGKVIPVINIRRRFRLPEREVGASDQLIIADTSGRTVALAADSSQGIIERREEEIIPSAEVVPGADYVEGVIKLRDGMVFIHDLDTFLSLEEEKKLDKAMKSK
jgi:purine-binding chemotaxis protein CheW